MWKKPRRKLSVAAGLWIGLLLTFIINNSIHRADDHPVLAPITPMSSSSDPAEKQMVLLSVPGLSFLELGDNPDIQASTPVLQNLKKASAWGAMNIRTSGRGAADVYLSLGAGQSAEGGSAARAVHKEEWKDGQLSLYKFSRFRGIDGAGIGSDLIVPEWRQVLRANENSYHRAVPGLLGETLRTAGIRLSVWGNAGRGVNGGQAAREDAARADRRYAPLMLTDRSGTVARGRVDESGLLWDGSYPSGLRTDYDWLLQRVREQKPGPSVTLLEVGDLQRLYDEKYLYTEEAFLHIKMKVLRDLDRFLGRLMPGDGGDGMSVGEGRSGNDNRQLWLFSPQVNADAAKQKALLAPLMIYSGDGQEGLLSSATTRRSGIVSFVDIAPTLLRAFQLEVPETMLGLPIQLEPKKGAWSELLAQVVQIKQVYAARPSLLYGLAVYEIIVMLSALGIGLFAVKRLGRRAREIGKELLFSLLLAPAGLLCMGWAPQGPTWLVGTVCLGGVFLLSAVCARYASDQARTIVCLAFIGLAVGILLLADGCQGAEAMQHSVLGYDVMIGARYYGMGNECMGVLLGAVLLGLTALQQALRQSRQPRRRQPVSSEHEPPAASADGPTAAAHAAALAAVPLSGFGSAAAPSAGPAAAPRVGTAADPLAGPTAASAAAPAEAGAVGRSLAGAWGAPRLAYWRRRWAIRAERARAAAWRAAPAAAAGLLVAGYLASPALGANAGGALSAALGFGALGARLAGGRRWKRTAPVLALLTGAALAGLWLLNHGAANGVEAHRQSHVGRAFEALLAGKLDLIGQIILRKLEMNVHLIGVSAWSKVLLTGLAVMAVLVLRPRGRFRRWQRQYPYLMHGVAANVIGTIAALVLNDSGIVAAATMIVYSSVPLLLLKLDEAPGTDKS